MLQLYLTMLNSEDDKATFTEIYENIKQLCFSAAFKITKKKDLAEDAVHDAFISVIKNKDNIFDLPCEKRASKIVIITKNKAIDILRRENIRTHMPIEDSIFQTESNAPDVSKILADKETFESLVDAVSSLPETYKSAAEMRFVLDMSNKAIAKNLGISPQAVSMRINRAKQKIKDILGKNGVEPNV